MKKVVLIGHCGPDNSYLRMAIQSADKSAQVFSVEDAHELEAALEQEAHLLLINRTLSYGFDETEGVELISRLRATHPQVKLMLVSNYEEAQAAAVEAGALPGFGKREIGSPKVMHLIRDALS
jgi:hypothetical protein